MRRRSSPSDRWSVHKIPFFLFSSISGNTQTLAQILYMLSHYPDRVLNPVQGLGKGPSGVLVGTLDGRFCHVKHRGKPQPLRHYSEDRSRPTSAVYCMAATDQLVVTGSDDGAICMLRMADVTCLA